MVWKETNFKKIKWVENVKGLGCEFGFNINYEEIWLRNFTKFKDELNKWKKRDLMMNGKKLLINAYIMSLSYLVDVYLDHIPLKFIKQTE